MQITAEQQSEGNENNTGAKAVLIAACVSGFLFQFDLTALSAALPDIAISLSAQTAEQAWIIHVYSLALIFALPLAGPMADRFGRRRLFMSGNIAFALSSVMCALATTLFSLLTWRVLQGIAGAALTASSAALLAAAYLGSRRAWAFGILGTVVGASMVAGPPLGALIAAKLSWQWVFWLNIPICFGLILLTRQTQSDPINQTPTTTQPSLDWAGPAALAACVGSLALAMLTSDATGIVSIGAWLGVCLAFLVIFIFIERRHIAPAFDLTLFGSPQFVAMCLVPIAGSIGYWSLLVHLPQMARGPMALSATATGLLLTALTAPMFLLPTIGAKLSLILPSRWYFSGGLVTIGGADLILAFTARDLSSPNAIWIIVTALLLGGAGCAIINAQITAAAVSAIAPNRAATAAAICVTMRQIGFACGIALIGAILQRNNTSEMLAYSNAFLVVAICTLSIAAIVFALLRR